MGTEFISVPIHFMVKIEMNKEILIQAIIKQLNADQQSLLQAARTAHLAATDPENSPDNKYETLALESSYIAQGQANRALDIRQAIDLYRQLTLRDFSDSDNVYLTALVVLEADSGSRKNFFLGPAAGGLKVEVDQEEVVVITPESPLGRDLLGKEIGDSVTITVGCLMTEYELITLC
jgi:transcription elongation GreA/GreB family factor